jgi:hypothetical protein
MFCLTECAVSETVRVDHGAAARAIQYCRRRAGGLREDTDAETEMMDFLHAHNISIDWAFDGDPSGLICTLVEGTTSRKPPNLRAV